MNVPLPIRAKLIAAALMLVIICALDDMLHIRGRSSGDALLRIACAVVGVWVALLGIFRSAQFQVVCGWILAFAGSLLGVVCAFSFRGSNLLLGFLAMVASFIGSYLLLLDAGVKDYRAGLTMKLRPNKRT